jgi:hypothetical protein
MESIATVPIVSLSFNFMVSTVAMGEKARCRWLAIYWRWIAIGGEGIACHPSPNTRDIVASGAVVTLPIPLQFRARPRLVHSTGAGILKRWRFVFTDESDRLSKLVSSWSDFFFKLSQFGKRPFR